MIIAVVASCVFLLSNMPSPLFALWETEMSFGAETTTWLFSAYQGGVLVGLLGLNRYIGRAGWRSLLATASAVSASAAILFAVASEPAVLGLARFISGLSVGVLLSYGAVAIARLRIHKGQRDGPMVAGISFSTGLALGPLLGGSYATLFPAQYRAVFAAEATALLVCTVVIVRSKALARLNHSAPLPVSPEAASRGSLRSCRAPVCIATFVLVSTGITCAVFMGIGSSYLKQQLGDVGPVVAGLLIAIVFGGAAGAQLLAKILGALWLAAAGPLVGVMSVVLLAYGVLAVDVSALFAAAALSGASQGLGQVAALTIVRDHAAIAEQRVALGRMTAWGYGISGSTVLLIGLLVRPLGLTAAIVYIAVAIGAASIIVLITAWINRQNL